MSTTRRRLILLAVALVGGLLVGVVASRLGGDDPAAGPTTTTTLSVEAELTRRPCLETVEPQVYAADLGLEVEQVARLASPAEDVFPTALVTLPDGEVLVGVRDGTVWSVGDDGAAEVRLDLRPTTTYAGDGGLLNLALADDGATLFVLRTAQENATTLTHHRLEPGREGEPARIGAGDEILRVERPGTMHAGGALVPLADGSVVVGIGDGGGLGGPEDRAQDPDLLLGKLVRVTPRPGQEPAYDVPEDNPLVAFDEFRPEILAVGLRNPYRAWLDPAGGRLVVTDVGQSCREEINVVSLPPLAPHNFGWPQWEGSHRFKTDGALRFGHTAPTYDYLAGCAIIGGYVYRGEAMPALAGRYLYADWCAGWIRALAVEEGGVVSVVELATVEAPTAIAPGPDGEPWITTADDGVHRLGPGSAGGPDGADAGSGGS